MVDVVRVLVVKVVDDVGVGVAVPLVVVVVVLPPPPPLLLPPSEERTLSRKPVLVYSWLMSHIMMPPKLE